MTAPAGAGSRRRPWPRRASNRGRERAGVEDQHDLADDPLVEQVRDPLDHLVLRDARRSRATRANGPPVRANEPCMRFRSSCRSRRAGRPSRPRRERTLGRATEPRGNVLRVVGDRDVGAGPADAGQRLEHGGALVEQALGRGDLDHRVFAADVVGGDRHAGRILDPPDVPGTAAGLDHQDVGALLDVELGLAHGLERVAGSIW